MKEFYKDKIKKEFFTVGDKVQLQPGDTYSKYAKIVEINDRGWVFKMIEPTSPKSDFSAGDIVFYSEQMTLVMKML
jgi:hypothetical protein